MSETIRIAVGSKNPVKLNACLHGFQNVFPEKRFSVTGHSVASGVADQPMSSEETLQGATNRAQVLRNSVNMDYFVGIEGGVEFLPEGLFASAWIVILDPAGNIARGRSGAFALPPKVQELIEAGVELGHANDQVFQLKDSKKSGGAIGSLTGGLISRQLLYEHAMALALIAFRQPELFHP